MLRVRPHHVTLAILLHAMLLMLFWWGKPVAPRGDPTRLEMEVLEGQLLPQRLVMLPPASQSEEVPEELDVLEAGEPIAYTSDTRPAIQAVPDQAPREPDMEGETWQPARPDNPPIVDEAREYARYVSDVLAPALGAASPSGMHAPPYTVRALSDTLVQEMLREGHARLVVKAGTAFFLGEEQDGYRDFRRIAELPGYARRALLLRSPLSQKVTQAIRREYGYTEADLTVLFVPSAALDRLILAKQTLAARQLNTSLTELRGTEGRLVRHGGAFTFLVEQVALARGTAVAIEDGEHRFMRAE